MQSFICRYSHSPHYCMDNMPNLHLQALNLRFSLFFQKKRKFIEIPIRTTRNTFFVEANNYKIAIYQAVILPKKP